MTLALARNSGRIMRELGSREALFLGLDVDGTLAPLADTPDGAKIPPATLSLLRRLESHERVTLVLVSGRSVREVRDMAQGTASWMVGNHGNERAQGGEPPELSLPPAAVRELNRGYRLIAEALSDVPGVLLEHKGATLGVHYRTVRPALRRSLRHRVKKAVSGLDLVVRPGKMMLDLRPPEARDKGQAVGELLAELYGPRWVDTAGVFYAGDDTTDEDVFSALAGKGHTVKVGPGRTKALYRTRSTTTLARWLDRLERRIA